jgi:transcriptional regulator with XRE-family HTH domain
MERLDDQRYLFRESGLDNVILDGVPILRCPSCEAWMPEIPSLSGALDAIACHLLLSPHVLSGPEIRFLRKSVGLAAKDFAVEIGKTPHHLSRLENGRLKVTPETSYLVRAKCAGAIMARSENTALKRRLQVEIVRVLSQIQRPAQKGYATLRVADLRRRGPLPDLRFLPRKPAGLFQAMSSAC